MLTIKEFAEVYRLGLNCGFFSKDEVIRWIDDYIDQNRDPEYTLIEVSLLHKKKSVEISSKLKELEGEQRMGYAVNVLFGLCYMELLNGHISEEDSCSFLVNLRNSDSLLNEKIIREIDVLTDEYYLAKRQIYGSIKDTSANIKKFLVAFKPYAEEFIVNS
jgi:hypothetical protein